MSLISWKNEFSVKIDEIDAQHKILIDLINQLHQAMIDGEANEKIEAIITGLTDYTKYHFEAEEKLFEDSDYPDTTAHKQTHIDFVRKISIFKTDFENKDAMLTVDVLQFLSSWLKEHILVTDMEYSAYLVKEK